MSQPSSSAPSGGKTPANPLNEPVGAEEFKARCLQIMDVVNETGAEVTMTEQGHPVAKSVPVGARVTRPPLLGSCKGSLIILNDDCLVPSTGDEWNDPGGRLGAGFRRSPPYPDSTE